MPVILAKSDVQPLTREHFTQGPLIGCIQHFNAFDEGDEITIHAGLRPDGVAFGIGAWNVCPDRRLYVTHKAWKQVYKQHGDPSWMKISLDGGELVVEPVHNMTECVIGQAMRFPF